MSITKLDTQAVRERRTTPGMVADVLRDAIRSGTLKAGQPLRQDELAAQFGLSRIPVREALRQLEGEGLVTVNPHRGAVVSTLSNQELQEICEIRVALECTAIRLAVPHLTDRTLAHAAEILTETDRETEVLEHWSRNNWLFHSTLYLPAQRPRLLSMIKQLHDTVDRYLRLHVSALNYKTKGQEEHWQLLDACQHRDAAAAAYFLEQHIEAVAVLLAKYLPNDQQASAAVE
jgi:DNA-binding GntR family transcriptional regulator